MNERDLPKMIDCASVSRKRAQSKVPQLVELFQGPKFTELLDAAPALQQTPFPRPDLETLRAMDQQETEAYDAWRTLLAQRVRAGEISIEAAIDAVHCYSCRMAAFQRLRWSV
jgi:hypothetical protein